jgi:hypothetical protein
MVIPSFYGHQIKTLIPFCIGQSFNLQDLRYEHHKSFSCKSINNIVILLNM